MVSVYAQTAIKEHTQTACQSLLRPQILSVLTVIAECCIRDSQNMSKETKCQNVQATVPLLVLRRSGKLATLNKRMHI